MLFSLFVIATMLNLISVIYIISFFITGSQFKEYLFQLKQYKQKWQAYILVGMFSTRAKLVLMHANLNNSHIEEPT